MNNISFFLKLSNHVFMTLTILAVIHRTGFAEPISTDDFVFVKGDCFQMGDVFGDGVDLEHPVHEVCLSDYSISKFEVTQRLYKKVMGTNPSSDQTNDRYPVDIVNYWQVEEFLEKLNTMTAEKYRLPTEAEWEFACRAGGKKLKYGTKDGTLSPDLANYNFDDSKQHGIMEVGSFPPNALGIYDMSGNVSEWVLDWYDRNYYKQSPKQDPVVFETRMPTLKVRRSGYWGNQEWIMRCSFRNYRRPAHRLTGLGFRLVKDSPEK